MTTRHLSDEQFEQLLAEDTGHLAATAHLRECPTCRRELDLVRSSVSHLRDLSLVWAEQRSVRIHPPSRTAMLWQSIPHWGLAAAALLLCSVGLGVHVHSAAADATAQVSRYEPAPPSAHELAQDNQLLQSIDNELHPQIRAQVSVSDLAGSSPSVRRNISREVVN